MNALTFPILRLLADGQFHSGEAIARRFGVTRATVWNALQDAEALGVRLFSVRGRGYRLPEPVRFLDAQRVQAGLEKHGHKFELQIHDQLDSTNSHLMQAASAGAPHGTCVAAELQTAGRGRRGRAWQAALGNSLTFSVLWRFQQGAGALSGLSLAVGVALMRALAELGVAGAGLKWPNDILHAQKKLAGILIELQGDMDGPSAAVIGIGLNLRLPESLRRGIDQPAADLQGVTKKAAVPDEVLGTTLRHLADVLQIFEQQGFAALRDEWQVSHAYHNQPVRVHMPDSSVIEGIASGVAEDGALLLETLAGMRRFAAGEISLRLAA
jgi:BirA family biotin operon repressor/biotin-[acetyl-CoA-carboxylase] ligase